MRVLLCAMAALAALAAARPLGNADIPAQVHLAQGDSIGSAVVVSWVTTSQADNQVRYGTKSGSYGATATNSTPAHTYTFVSAYIGSYTSGFVHHVNVTDLAFDTTYYYVCGSAAGWSPEFSFTTGPAPGPETHTTLAIIGDLGQTSDSTLTASHVWNNPRYMQTVIVGDLSYADSATNPQEYNRNCTQARWDSWGEIMEPLLAVRTMMACPGNHEVEQEGAPPATQTPFLAFQERFRMPSDACGAGEGNLYYSWNIGNIHFVSLNSYMPYSVNSAQYKWLLVDLARYDRARFPWLVAMMHAPWYNSNTCHQDEPEEWGMRFALEDIFMRHGVDLVFSGHVHAYERMFPTYKGQPTKGAPTYINIGDGGNREGPCPDYLPQPPYSAFREGVFGHGEIDAVNSTHLNWAWHRNQDDESVTADHITLVKNAFLGTAATGVTAFGPTTRAQYDGLRHKVRASARHGGDAPAAFEL